MGLFNRLSPQGLRLLALLAVILLLLAFFASQIDGYFNARLFSRISGSVAIMALIATAQTLVILTRNIDLSIGSIVGFTAFAAGNLVSANPEMNALLLVVFCCVVGAGFGAVNGLIVAYARVPSIIVTLATMAIFRSLLVEYSDGKSITTNTLPVWLTEFPNMPVFTLFGLEFRAAFVAALVVVFAVHLALTRLRPMRQFFAVGSNPEAAEMAGIDAKRVVFSAFVLSGALAGLAGLLFLARFGNITVVAGLGFELKSVASAVVGGVNIFGGSGSVIGALLGAVLVDVIDTSLVRWAIVSEFWREAVLGALILVDQHAAHERLTHERLAEEMRSGGVRSQPLLLPAVVELPQAARLAEAAPELAQLGLELEGFGPGAVIVRALPAVLGAPDPAPLLRDLAEELAESGEGLALAARLDAAIARLACHGSIRAGRRLTPAEMDALLRAMERTPRAATCSHGRPTYLRFGSSEFARLFGRS